MFSSLPTYERTGMLEFYSHVHVDWCLSPFTACHASLESGSLFILNVAMLHHHYHFH
jgi:hypothetical protein